MAVKYIVRTRQRTLFFPSLNILGSIASIHGDLTMARHVLPNAGRGRKERGHDQGLSSWILPTSLPNQTVERRMFNQDMKGRLK
jgi:hypothetical protein